MSLAAAYAAVGAALRQTDPAAKCAQVQGLGWPVDEAAADDVGAAVDFSGVPGRPARPCLVHPAEVPRRGVGSVEGRVALIHAVAHIEFNAINLALDAVYRFRGLPSAYARDWLSVAQDEARHFTMLNTRLGELGHAYGDFEAHNGLWEAAEKTAHDPLERMALVPRVLEARGLDVTPGMMQKLREAGDAATAAILQVILDEEVRHVALGTHWYRWLCAQRGVDADATFARLLAQHGARLRPPFNRAAREAAGFSAREFAEASASR